MAAILVMFNNYLHDFATAMVVVLSYVMLLMARHAERSGSIEVKSMVVWIYPRMLHITAGAFIFLIIAGVVRTFTFVDFEWADAAGRGQVGALATKHVLLFILFGYGIYLWVKVYGKVKVLKKETGAVGSDGP